MRTPATYHAAFRLLTLRGRKALDRLAITLLATSRAEAQKIWWRAVESEYDAAREQMAVWSRASDRATWALQFAQACPQMSLFYAHLDRLSRPCGGRAGELN